MTGAEVAVRSIHSAASGNKIGGLEDIRNGGNYVAAGNERFVPMEYNKFHEVFFYTLNFCFHFAFSSRLVLSLK